MEVQRRICTLCMRKCETFKCIERNTKSILDLFLPKMDFTIIQGPVMCGTCAETLAKCFDFKTTCLHTYDYLVSFVNNKDDVKLDLNDLFQSRSMTDTSIPEDQGICGFCMGLVKNCNAIPLYIKDEDYKLDKMVQQCLPELDLSVIKEPVICADCHSSLESCFRFVTDCLTAEQKIRHRENLDMSSKGQIELSHLLHPAIKTEKTNDVDSNSYGIVKIEKQICEDGENPEQSEMVSGVNIIELEETSCINENSNHNIESVNTTLITLDNNLLRSPKNLLIWDEESNKLSGIKVEETLCEENETQCKDDIFVEMKDKKCLINEEIEIKTDGHDFNRFDESAVMTKPTVNTKLNEESLKHKDPTILKMYKCGSCTFCTKLIGNLKKHSLKHKELPKVTIYTCDSCTYRTKFKHSLKIHSLKHTDTSEVTIYKCDSCTYQTPYKYKLHRHSRKHKDPSEVTMYKCDSCTFVTIYQSSLKQHLLKHKDTSELTMYKCDSCTYQTPYKYKLHIHSRKHKDPSEVTMYKCDSCTFVTIYQSSLKLHLLKHKDTSELTMYKCDSCTYQTRYIQAFNRHSLRHKDQSEVTMYKCDSCAYQTSHKYELQRHSLRHKDPSEVTLYKCDSCTYQTIYENRFKQHMLRHKDTSEVTMYNCDSCTYQTIYKRNLKQHLLVHKDPSEVTMYKCDSCTYQTPYKYKLHIHSRKHKDPSEVTISGDS